MLTQKQIDMLKDAPDANLSRYTGGSTVESTTGTLAELASNIKTGLKESGTESLDSAATNGNPAPQVTTDAAGKVDATQPTTPSVEINDQKVTDPSTGGDLGNLPPEYDVDVLMKEALGKVSKVQIESVIGTSKILAPRAINAPKKIELKIGEEVKLKSGKTAKIEAISYGDDFKTINALKVTVEGKTEVIKESEVVDPNLTPTAGGDTTQDAAGKVTAGAPAAANAQSPADQGTQHELPTPSSSEEPSLGKGQDTSSAAAAEWTDAGYPI